MGTNRYSNGDKSMTTAQVKRIEALEKDMKVPVEPMTILLHIVRPDRSTQGYLIRNSNGEYEEVPPESPLLAGFPPITEAVNGGYRPGEENGGAGIR